jgi:hypothetical protein
MHQDQEARRGRLIASVAATVISLACGTNVSNHFHDFASSYPRTLVQLIRTFPITLS